MTLRNWKKRIGLAASRIAISGNYMLRRPKCSKIEAVAPKEEESTLATPRISSRKDVWYCITERYADFC
jgi:hypothetical protein